MGDVVIKVKLLPINIFFNAAIFIAALSFKI